MGKLNCWNWKNCGRYPGGPKTSELGACPAATFGGSDGFLNGRNGGRACCYITGTFCGGKIQGTHMDKSKGCKECDYYFALKSEFGNGLSLIQFNKYADSSTSAGTPDNQDWVATYKTGDETSKGAKRRYRIYGLTTSE